MKKSQYTKSKAFFYKNLGEGRCLQIFISNHSNDISISETSDKLMYGEEEVEATREEFEGALLTAKDRINKL